MCINNCLSKAIAYIFHSPMCVITQLNAPDQQTAKNVCLYRGLQTCWWSVNQGVIISSSWLQLILIYSMEAVRGCLDTFCLLFYASIYYLACLSIFYLSIIVSSVFFFYPAGCHSRNGQSQLIWCHSPGPAGPRLLKIGSHSVSPSPATFFVCFFFFCYVFTKPLLHPLTTDFQNTDSALLSLVHFALV